MPSLPSLPGVYWFLGEKDKVLYVGKAKNLKKRVTSYSKYPLLHPRTKKMVSTAKNLKFKILDNEIQSLLVEAELIRLHQPAFNILLKDDKTPIYLEITKEAYPRILMIRKQDIYKKQTKSTILGPFQSAYKLKQVLKIVRRIFLWCDEAGKTTHKFIKPCFYYHLDLCSGACIKKIDQTEYQDNIKELTLFLQGKKKTVLKSIQRKMLEASQETNFELAIKKKQQLELVQLITDPAYKLKPEKVLPSLTNNTVQEALLYLRDLIGKYFYLPKNYFFERIEGYDVSNISGLSACVSMVVFSQGQANNKEYKLFNIRSKDTPDDFAMLAEALQRRLKHPEWGKPNLILIDGGKGQLGKILKFYSWENPVISLAKNPDRLIIPYRQDNILHYKILNLARLHPGLKILAQVRDEAHRFAKLQFSRLHTKKLLT